MLPSALTASEEEAPGWGSIFSLGWACADRSHIPALPEALALLLRVPAVRVAVIHTNGTPVAAYRYRQNDDSAPLDEAEVANADIGEFHLQIGVGTILGQPLSAGQKENLRRAMELIRLGLECTLVSQADRVTLGMPFSDLSDREWEVCKALEGPQGEKQIATEMACSRHTVHSYVKGVYRKMRLRSRLQVIDLLRKARESLRCRAVATFAASDSTS